MTQEEGVGGGIVESRHTLLFLGCLLFSVLSLSFIPMSVMSLAQTHGSSRIPFLRRLIFSLHKSSHFIQTQ